MRCSGSRVKGSQIHRVLPITSMSHSDGKGDVPQLFSIFHGEVASLQAYGAFVKIPGCKKQGLVHKSQMSTARIEDPSEMLAKGEKVYCKVIGFEGEGEKISLSMKVVNQTTGTDLDPNNVQLDQDAKKRRQWKHIGKERIELGAELNTTCRRCGGHGHLTIDCFAGKDGTQYELIPDLETLTALPPISEATDHHHKKKKKKKEKKKKKKKKAKKKKHSSSSSSSSSDDGDGHNNDDENGFRQRRSHSLKDKSPLNLHRESNEKKERKKRTSDKHSRSISLTPEGDGRSDKRRRQRATSGSSDASSSSSLSPQRKHGRQHYGDNQRERLPRDDNRERIEREDRREKSDRGTRRESNERDGRRERNIRDVRRERDERDVRRERDEREVSRERSDREDRREMSDLGDRRERGGREDKRERRDREERRERNVREDRRERNDREASPSQPRDNSQAGLDDKKRKPRHDEDRSSTSSSSSNKSPSHQQILNKLGDHKHRSRTYSKDFKSHHSQLQRDHKQMSRHRSGSSSSEDEERVQRDSKCLTSGKEHYGHDRSRKLDKYSYKEKVKNENRFNVSESRTSHKKGYVERRQKGRSRSRERDWKEKKRRSRSRS
ncbi:nucleolar protein of 40 kDa-like [Elysia marginata]|uniref:Zinc finger CCHC domain-containing protein 17 n=1 Tax=Elysia marginata TaxID=1093978 RepID=A0AAV4GRR9_9GAST|nr:nucleolar protein of 40 kDa-like [Elysia marginata]